MSGTGIFSADIFLDGKRVPCGGNSLTHQNDISCLE
jgi:hypothetical protein